MSTHSYGADQAVLEAVNVRGNEVVFLDIALGGDDKGKAGNPLGRIKLELFVKDVSFF